MSEQTANLCTTDACESLRARLAKYEDEEGRPVVQLSADTEQEAQQCLFVLREIGSMDADDISGDDMGCDVSIVEYAERSAVAIEALLSALKSQPSGVVLPEPMKRGDEGGSGEYGAAMIRGYNACLREVARLNPAPSHGEQVRELPECVLAWFEAKKAHVKAVGDYNARMAFVKQHMPFGTSVDPEYQIMEAADRKVRDLVWPMFVGLMEIDAPSAGSQEQG